MRKPAPPYRVYLLTVWQEPNQPPHLPLCRFRLEDPRSGHSRGFTTIAGLVVALLRGVDAEESTEAGATDAEESPPKGGTPMA